MKLRLILVSVLIAGLMLNSGCSAVFEPIQALFSNDDNGRDHSDSQLSLYNLTQRLVDAIRIEADSESVYRSLSVRQLDQLSLNEFQQYIRLIRRGIPGEIQSFTVMSSQELLSMQNEMLTALPQQQELIDQMQGVWLQFREAGRGDSRFALFFHDDGEGQLSLSAGWVRQVLRLYDLANLYFDAIDRSDEEALALLLRQDHPDLAIDLLRLKARRIIEFYRQQISTRTSEFRLEHVRIDSLAFEGFRLASQNPSGSDARTIEIRATAEQQYQIVDVIPDTLAESDLLVYFNRQPLLQFAGVEDGQLVMIRSNNFESMVGAPAIHDDSNCTTSGNRQKLSLEYENLDIEVEGTCFRHSRWDGVVQKIVLKDDEVRLGSGLGPGMTLDDVLRRYPFAKETEFTISGQFEGGQVLMTIEMRGTMINAITLELAGY